MTSKSVDLILAAVKSAGDGALRLHEDNERLRGLLTRCYDLIENDRWSLWDGATNEPGLEPEVAHAIGRYTDQPSPVEPICPACHGSGEGGFEYVDNIAVGHSPCVTCNGTGLTDKPSATHD